jgi:magnesium transporter
VIVDAAWYVEGCRTVETDSIEKLAAERGSAGFGWLGLRMPSEAELDTVRDAFELPELAIADARQRHDRPKVERHGDCLLTVVPTARYADDLEEVEFGELFLYAGRDYLLSVRYGHAAPLAGVRHELEEHPDRLACGPGAVLQAALLHVVQSYEPVIEGLEHDVREVERDVFSESRDQPTKRIYLLIREILDFLVALEPMSSAVKKLTSVECTAWVRPEIVPLFRDVDDALSEIVERGRTVHQLLQNALTASRAEAERQQNADTRKISAWAAIGIVPTIVAGLFGMNLGGIPFERHWVGFGLVSALTLGVCVLLYRRFKRIDWL